MGAGAKGEEGKEKVTMFSAEAKTSDSGNS